MARRPSAPEPLLIEQQEQVDELCAQCTQEQRFAFDTEFVMEDRYESEVCLIQIATRDTVAIIDPFSSLDLNPVWSLVSNEHVETLVHAGLEDLALCVQHTGQVPRNTYDVQIAAGFAGLDYPLSLQRLVQHTLHIRLHKSKTLTDWRRRPLTASQIHYAAEDVCHLLAVRNFIEKRLVQHKRTEWVQEEFKRFEEMTLYRRAEEDKIARVKGAGSLRGQHLAIVHELLSWREAFAKRVNRPARVALKDYLLVEIAKHAMTEFAEIRSLRGLNLSDRDVRQVCRAVQQALELPKSQWPASKPQDHETPRQATLVALVTAIIRSYCAENDLAYGLVATQKSIKNLIRSRHGERSGNAADVELLKGWRGQSVGALIDDVLSGKRTLSVDPTDGQDRLRFALARSPTGLS